MSYQNDTREADFTTIVYSSSKKRARREINMASKAKDEDLRQEKQQRLEQDKQRLKLEEDRLRQVRWEERKAWWREAEIKHHKEKLTKLEREKFRLLDLPYAKCSCFLTSRDAR